ncbi:MAG TPA: multiheme c-type cytochrome [Oscillospiraceae bacterium]|nr:multiheme c-type cytochrome [Oscillospiraceae bacterium]
MLCLIICCTGKVVSAATADSSCRECHSGAAADLDRGSKGEFMLCTDCHGSDHNGPGTGEPGTPTPKTCAQCHAEEVAQFNEGKHYWAIDAMEAVPTYQKMPSEVTDKGCVVCHQVGQKWDDGSQGRCDSCHTRHVFSAAEASTPESCGTCHTGDHPQYEIWANSKHGKLYNMEGGEERAPACLDCHDSHRVVTAWGFLGLRPGEQEDEEWLTARNKVQQALETMGPGLAPNVTRETYVEWEGLREEMVTRCTECHAESYVREDLAKSDALVREADLMMANVVTVADMLYDQNLVDEQSRFMIYRDSTAHRFATFMGGFHNSALYSWDKGYLGLTSDMVALRDRAITAKKASLVQTAVIAAVVLIFLLIITTIYLLRKRKQAEQK